MPTLAVWFIRRRGAEHDDEPILVRVVEELDAVLAMVVVAGGGAGAMVEVSVAEDAGSPVLEVGLGARRGFVRYQSVDDEGWTVGDTALTGLVGYRYPGGIRDVPVAVEVSVAVVRNCLREFLRTGRQPGDIRLIDRAAIDRGSL